MKLKNVQQLVEATDQGDAGLQPAEPASQQRWPASSVSSAGKEIRFIKTVEGERVALGEISMYKLWKHRAQDDAMVVAFDKDDYKWTLFEGTHKACEECIRQLDILLGAVEYQYKAKST